MNIIFAVVVCILSCGIEGILIDEQFCKEPSESGLKDHYSRDRIFVIDQANQYYYGTGTIVESEPDERSYTIVPERDENITYLSEVVDGVQIIKYELKYVSFSTASYEDKNQTIFCVIITVLVGTIIGNKQLFRYIIAYAVFEKDKCDITLKLVLFPTSPEFGEILNERLEEYLQAAYSNTESHTKHDLKWIEDWLKNPYREVSSTLNGGRSTQEYGCISFPVTENAIQWFLEETGLHSASD